MKKINKNKKYFFVKDNDNNKFWDMIQNGKWENNTFIIFDKFIDKDHSYIDIGAWIGPTVLYGCQLAKHCYAIEPDPVAFKILQNNLDLNSRLKNKITLCNNCISDECGDIKFGNSNKFGNSMSSILFDNSNNSCIVKSITFDKLIQLNNINDCNFIKMDIEGGETIVLPNIKDYLEKNKPTLYLSLHPHLFKNVDKDSKIIINILRIYKNIFYDNSKLINLNELLSKKLLKKERCEIVATDRDWN